jgi:hypothetical protein
MELQPVKSSLIKVIGYDRDTGKLVIEFTKGGKFAYSGVTEQFWDEFRTAPSQGKFFMAEIKGKLPFESIVDKRSNI